MTQVEAASRVRTQSTSSFRGNQTTEGSGFEMEFVSLLRKGAAQKMEGKEKEEKVSWKDKKEPELPEDGVQEEPVSEEEVNSQQLLNPWLAFSANLMQQIHVAGTEEMGTENSSGLVMGGVLPGQAENSPGTEGDFIAMEPQPGQMETEGIQSEPVSLEGSQQISARTEKEILTAPQTEEVLEADPKQEAASGFKPIMETQTEPVPERKDQVSALEVGGATKENQDRGPKDGDQESALSNGQGFGTETQHQGVRTQRLMSGTQAERTSFSEQYSGETIRMQTSEQVLGRDTAELLASRMPLKEGVLHLELEPVHLGKLTVQVAFESGRTAVTVMSSNAETLEILSRNAGQIAQILEDRTGQQTVVYTPQSSEAGEQSAAEKQGHQENRQDRQEHRNERDQSFAQQLRLGLV